MESGIDLEPTRKLIQSLGWVRREERKHPESFGSWFLEIFRLGILLRVVWEGKESDLLIQTKDADGNWINLEIVSKGSTVDKHGRIRKACIEALPEKHSIRNPDGLYGLVRAVALAVDNGSFKQIAGNCRPQDLKEGKTWPDDVLELTFQRTKDKQVFQLTCEVYHGFGGLWYPIEEIEVQKQVRKSRENFKPRKREPVPHGLDRRWYEYIEEGDRMEKKGNWKEAIEYWKAAIAADPGEPGTASLIKNLKEKIKATEIKLKKIRDDNRN